MIAAYLKQTDMIERAALLACAAAGLLSPAVGGLAPAAACRRRGFRTGRGALSRPPISRRPFDRLQGGVT